MNKWLEDLQHADPAAAAEFVELDNEHIRLQADAHRAAALTKAARLRVQKFKASLEPKVDAWRRERTRPPGHIEELALDFGYSNDVVVRFGQVVSAPNPFVEVDVYEWMGKRHGLKSGWVPSRSFRLHLTGVLQGRRMVMVHPNRLRELLAAAGIEIPTMKPKPPRVAQKPKLTAEEIAAAVDGDSDLRAALAEKGVMFK